MPRTSVAAIMIALLIGVPQLLHAQAPTQEFKGQIQIGSHRVKLEVNRIYEVTLDHPRDFPLQVNSSGVQLQFTFGPDFQARKMYCMPTRTGFVNFIVASGGFAGGNNTTCDYVLKVQGKSLNDKPVLQEDSKWTDQDPTYKQHNSQYKDYKIKLTGGRLYIIDLVKGGPGLDPYLFLEGPDGRVVAQDDDSGGDLNARIIYAPPQDGEFRIIATTLVRATGDFTLTVRQAE
jgi:hypothetical protein